VRLCTGRVHLLPDPRFIYYLMLAGLTFRFFLAIVPLFFDAQELPVLLNTLPGLILTYVAFAFAVHCVLPLYAFFHVLFLIGDLRVKRR